MSGDLMKVRKKNRQINIRLSESLLDKIQDCADVKQMSISELIRVKMERVVNRNNKEADAIQM